MARPRPGGRSVTDRVTTQPGPGVWALATPRVLYALVMVAPLPKLDPLPRPPQP